MYKVRRCLKVTISRFAVVPNTNTRYETHDAERIMQSESTHVRTGCAKLRKKNARMRPTGNIVLRRRARRTREKRVSPVGEFMPPLEIDLSLRRRYPSLFVNPAREMRLEIKSVKLISCIIISSGHDEKMSQLKFVSVLQRFLGFGLSLLKQRLRVVTLIVNHTTIIMN